MLRGTNVALVELSYTVHMQVMTIDVVGSYATLALHASCKKYCCNNYQKFTVPFWDSPNTEYNQKSWPVNQKQ